MRLILATFTVARTRFFDCAMQFSLEWGSRRVGKKKAKKRAIVTVARKLAVLLHKL